MLLFIHKSMGLCKIYSVKIKKIKGRQFMVLTKILCNYFGVRSEMNVKGYIAIYFISYHLIIINEFKLTKHMPL